MASIEFWLSRLTAQSPPMLKLPGGAVPYMTAEDIAQAAAMIRDPNAYQLMLAKYCQDEWAVEQSIKYARRTAWRMWGEKERRARVDVETMNRIGELALVEFMLPNSITKRSEAGRARFVRVDVRTWSANFAQHYKEVAAHLFALESEARRQMTKRLKRA